MLEESIDMAQFAMTDDVKDIYFWAYNNDSTLLHMFDSEIKFIFNSYFLYMHALAPLSIL